MSMTFEDYKEEVFEAAKYALEEEYVFSNDIEFDEVYDILLVTDSVTGNSSGSYTCNTEQAKDNVSYLIWEPETTERFRFHGYSGIPMEQGAETIDVMLRCFALYDVFEDLEEAFEAGREKQREYRLERYHE